MRRLLAFASAVLLSACATSTPVANTPVSATLDDDRPPPLDIRRPQSSQEAGAMLALAAAYLDQGRRTEALPLLVALRGTDFLTERGQANLYWMIATAAEGIDPALRIDALGGYLVASSITDDLDQRARRQHAKAQLLANHVKQHRLGTTENAAIDVQSKGEADIVVASLVCGRDGDGHYVERSVPDVLRTDDAPRPRRLLCTENGDELLLWFRVQP